MGASLREGFCLLDKTTRCNYNVCTSFISGGILMTAAITTRLISVGNSRGIRIPKLLLDQLKFGEEVTLSVEQDRLIVRAVGRPRRLGRTIRADGQTW